MFNPLTNKKVLDVTKLKAFEDDKSNVAEIANSLFDRVENTVGKEKMIVTSIFIFSLIVSFKALFFRVVKLELFGKRLIIRLSTRLDQDISTGKNESKTNQGLF